MNKIVAIFDLFRRGNAIADPATLHDKDKLVIALSAFIVALGKFAGLDWFTEADANALAGGIVVVYLGVQHYISSPSRGLPAKPEPAPGADEGRAGG